MADVALTTIAPRPMSFVKLMPLFLSLLFFCAFLALCCRGVLEVTIGKSLAYVVQLLLWTFTIICALVFFRFRITKLMAAGSVLTCLFGLVAVISAVLTLDIRGSGAGLISAGVNIYLLLLFVIGYGFRTDAFSARAACVSMAVAGVLLPVFGLLQLAGFAELPGRSLIRMPSLTGSYLHFPLIAGIIGVCLVQAAKTLRWWLLYFVAMLCFVGVGISGGRSGAVVLVGTGALYVFLEFLRKPAAAKFSFLLRALAIAGLFSAVIAVAYQYSPSLQRIAQLGSLQESGNAVRVNIWSWIYDHWSQTNLWFGEYAGLVGNTTNNLNGGVNQVAESGALQQIISFGALGFLLFYSAMIPTYFGIERNSTFLRALFISAMVQTYFYQSTEVFPYMAMLAFLPLFSQSLERALHERAVTVM